MEIKLVLRAGVRGAAAADPLHGQRDPHRGRRHLLQSLRPRQSGLQGSRLQPGFIKSNQISV